jgi:type IV pilus assembly protein PilA
LFCALCGADNPNDGRFCSKCGALLQGQRPLAPAVPAFDGPAPPYIGPSEMSGKAIGSLICGILFFFFPVAIVAILLGHLSLSEIRQAGGRLTGRGLAIAGLVLGYAGISFIPILIIAAIAIPNLLRARMAANEASAIGSLRSIETAAFTYSSRYSNGFPPFWVSLEGLGGPGTIRGTCDSADLLDWTLVSGQKAGYRFSYSSPVDPGEPWPPVSREAAAKGCTRPGGKTFQVHADPITRGTTGQRSFYTDQTGIIRYNVYGPATGDSPPLQ